MRLIRDIYSDAQLARRPVISFEFFPTKTPEGERTLLEKTIPALSSLTPDFCSVTYGAEIWFQRAQRWNRSFEKRPLTFRGFGRKKLEGNHRTARQLRVGIDVTYEPHVADILTFLRVNMRTWPG